MSDRLPFEIRALRDTDISAILTAEGGPWWLRDQAYWSRCLVEQHEGTRSPVVAVCDGKIAAYAHLLWRSEYPAFGESGIPEINNLRVAEGFRRRGIAKSLIAHFERLAVTAGHPAIGLGVGLYADYGAAQQLYVTLGYVPDGHGVMYRYCGAAPGSMVQLDDELLLWLVKRI